jgi:catechol 2,3-dioxygenase-like lactoylglutathione lyase family enzyme
MTQIGYTILVVDSVQESLAFWTEGLGFRLETLSAVKGYQTLVSSSGQTFALVEASVLESYLDLPISLPLVEQGKWQNPLFLSLEVDDLKSTLDQLNPFQIQLLKAPSVMPWGATVAFIQELQSGLCFELMQKTHK